MPLHAALLHRFERASYSVPYNISSLTVTPTLADSTATITVNSVPVTSGSASGAINLKVGANLITVIVTAEDGATRTTTTITVTRPHAVVLPMIAR
jgi:Cadherin-like beta sandwich domain